MTKSKKCDGSFVMLERGLIQSNVWRSMSINCRRLLDFLFEEHLAKGGKENGHLKATYNQLVCYGISRRLVHRTITEAEQLGLIRVERGGRRGFVSDLSNFMITFLPTYKNSHFVKPLHDWKGITDADIKSIQDRPLKSIFQSGTLTVPVTDTPQFH